MAIHARRTPLLRTLVVLVAVVLVAASCASDPPSDPIASEGTDRPAPTTTPDATPTPEATTPAPTPTPELPPPEHSTGFASTIQPIFADRCASCHNAGGPGSPHWTLDTAGDISLVASDLTDHLTTGFMPPWPASEASVAFVADRSLTEEEIDAVVAWIEDGSPFDVPLDTPIASTTGIERLGDDAVALSAGEPYTGSIATSDDYRCLIYDPQVSQTEWITAYDFRPDQTEVVHHALGYLLPQSMRARADELDSADGKPGWSCYGGTGLGASDIFLGWAPGQGATHLPDGSGLPLEPGQFLVMQIHYHYEDRAPADSSWIELELASADEIEAAGGRLDEIVVSQFVAPAEIPCRADESGPLCDRDAAITRAIEKYGPEGVQADGILGLCGATPDDFATMTDGVASASCDLEVYEFGEIISVLGHEHEIGRSFRMTLNPDTPDELVLLDIPDWDFDWQFNYQPVDRIELEPGDVVRIECSWDRAKRDPDLEPAYVLWADGTDDEMCFSTITTRA